MDAKEIEKNIQDKSILDAEQKQAVTQEKMLETSVEVKKIMKESVSELEKKKRNNFQRSSKIYRSTKSSC